jgi:hypothetical protein
VHVITATSSPPCRPSSKHACSARSTCTSCGTIEITDATLNPDQDGYHDTAAPEAADATDSPGGRGAIDTATLGPDGWDIHLAGRRVWEAQGGAGAGVAG